MDPYVLYFILLLVSVSIAIISKIYRHSKNSKAPESVTNSHGPRQISVITARQQTLSEVVTVRTQQPTQSSLANSSISHSRPVDSSTNNSQHDLPPTYTEAVQNSEQPPPRFSSTFSS
jgi:hypothetical protein